MHHQHRWQLHLLAVAAPRQLLLDNSVQEVAYEDTDGVDHKTAAFRQIHGGQMTVFKACDLRIG